MANVDVRRLRKEMPVERYSAGTGRHPQRVPDSARPECRGAADSAARDVFNVVASLRWTRVGLLVLYDHV